MTIVHKCEEEKERKRTFSSSGLMGFVHGKHENLPSDLESFALGAHAISLIERGFWKGKKAQKKCVATAIIALIPHCHLFTAIVAIIVAVVIKTIIADSVMTQLLVQSVLQSSKR